MVLGIYDVYFVTGKSYAGIFIVPTGIGSLKDSSSFEKVLKGGYRMIQEDGFGNVEVETPSLDSDGRGALLKAFENKRIHREKSILVRKLSGV